MVSESTYFVSIFERGTLMDEFEFDSPIELGRQDFEHKEPEPYALGRMRDDRQRVIIAPKLEKEVSRSLVSIDTLPDGQFEIRRISSSTAVSLNGNGELKVGEAIKTPEPFDLSFGIRRARISRQPQVQLQSLAVATMAPGQALREHSLRLPRSASGTGPRDLQSLVLLLQKVLDVIHLAKSPHDLFVQAADAVVNIVGLDSGRVLLWGDGNWTCEASTAPPTTVGQPGVVLDASRTVLNRVRQDRRTFWQPDQLSELQGPAMSLSNVKFVVAAPLLNAEGEVFGVLYGDRREFSENGSRITQMDAMLMELIAVSMASVMVRWNWEQEARRHQVLFEQFFTRELSEQLQRDPELLRGRDAEATILFCDIQQFSAISEKLGAKRTFDWIKDVLGELSDCILRHRGVLVDYIGDCVLAMWNAPTEQPDHAQLAVAAAREMLQRLPVMNTRWKEEFGGVEFGLGIGINTGPVTVGNSGSEQKFKYGPLGHAVNLASRVEGATRHLKVPLLITGSTWKLLPDSVPTRRLCTVQVKNIEEPTDLYEVAALESQNYAELKGAYETALSGFEQGDFHRVARMLGNLMEVYPKDGPSILLMSRTVNAILNPEDFSHVWTLPSK